MHQLLKLKQTVQLSNHGTATVDHFLGGGGQGVPVARKDCGTNIR